MRHLLVFFMILFGLIVAPFQSEIHAKQASAAGIKQALVAVKKGQWSKAERLFAETRDPTALKLFYWLSYTQHDKEVPFNRISAFAKQADSWPRHGRLRLKAEKVFENKNHGVDREQTVRWFDDFAPLTHEGMDAYMAALVSKGETTKAKTILNAWWGKTLLNTQDQSYFLSRYGSLLNADSHKARFSKLLFNDYYTAARALARVMGKGYPQLAEARIALSANKAGVDGLIRNVPDHLKDDPGLLFERLRWRRQREKNYGALEILHNMPPAEVIPNPSAWWRERHIMARRLIEQKQYESAYKLVSKHIQEEGVAFAEAEFLAGWLALRFVKKPWRAFEHFEALYYRTKTPISRSRGAYWAARASEGLGHKGIAEQWYRTAATHGVAFYGQLALETLEQDNIKAAPPMPPAPTFFEQQEFDQKDFVIIARLLKEAGFRSEASAFLNAIVDEDKSANSFYMAAKLAKELGHTHDALRISKKALRNGVLLSDFSYPTILKEVRKIDTEWALVHAIIRQESAFDPLAQSPAGASGLMQLMPGTARDTARALKISHKQSWLLSRPSHNIRLGSYYIDQLIEDFDGSYAMALAAYNGGPGNVRKWVEIYGDPRKGEIAYLDWIELIPFKETRNYVQRVLESTYIYRLKLKNIQKNTMGDLHIAFIQD